VLFEPVQGLLDMFNSEHVQKMNYPAAELRGIKMNFYLINPDAEHRGILLIKHSSLPRE